MNTKKTEIVSLESLSGGAVVERFGLALQDVLDNIIDPNTEPKKTRSITLKFTVKPDESREFCTVEIGSETKLAPISPLSTHFFIGMKNGSGVACERSTRQADMFAEKPLPENVTPINSAKEAVK
jgi:hypothetical protein